MLTSINTALTTNDAQGTTGQTAAVFVVNGDTTTIKNVVFASANSRYDVNVSAAAVLNVENCMFTTPTASVMKDSDGDYLRKRALYVSSGSATLVVDGGVFDDKVYAFNGGNDDNNFTFKNVTLKGWMSGAGTHTF